MKTLYKLLGIIVLSAAIFSGCNDNMSDSSSVSNNPGTLLKGVGPSASGQGQIVGTDRVFAFTAVTKPDGSVSGQGQLTFTQNSVKIHFSIDCISVTDNTAIITMLPNICGSSTVKLTVWLPTFPYVSLA